MPAHSSISVSATVTSTRYSHEDSPSIPCIAVDRSPYTKAFNDVEFNDIPNLSFRASDITDALSSASGGTLFHSRTMTLIPQASVSAIYRLAGERGIKYVAGFEPIGLSRETLAPYTFTLEPKRSVHYRHFMFIHNYPALLREAGFSVKKFYPIKTHSPHKDLAILCFDNFEASRKGLPVDRFDLLILASGPRISGADDRPWARWLGYARRLSSVCHGAVLANAACPEWTPLLASITGRRSVKSASLPEILEIAARRVQKLFVQP